jgi:hypothetical protein
MSRTTLYPLSLPDKLHKYISDWKEEYLADGFLFMQGEEVCQALSLLGVTDSELDSLLQSTDSTKADPTLIFRKTQNARFLTSVNSNSIKRLVDQPFLLSSSEGFQRHDSGLERIFDSIPQFISNNIAILNLFAIKISIVQDKPLIQRMQLDYGDERWITTLFNIKTLSSSSLLGHPALEGVHSDGVDHTMTTFINGYNMREDAAVTTLHHGIKLTHDSMLEPIVTLIFWTR